MVVNFGGWLCARKKVRANFHFFPTRRSERWLVCYACCDGLLLLQQHTMMMAGGNTIVFILLFFFYTTPLLLAQQQASNTNSLDKMSSTTDNNNSSNHSKDNGSHEKTIFLIRHAESEENRRLGSLKSAFGGLARCAIPSKNDVYASLELLNVSAQIDSDVSPKGKEQVGGACASASIMRRIRLLLMLTA